MCLFCVGAKTAAFSGRHLVVFYRKLRWDKGVALCLGRYCLLFGGQRVLVLCGCENRCFQVAGIWSLFCAGVKAVASTGRRCLLFRGWGVLVLCGRESCCSCLSGIYLLFVGAYAFFVYVTALPCPAGIVRPSARIDLSFCRRQAAAAYPSPYWRSNCRCASSRKCLGWG